MPDDDVGGVLNAAEAAVRELAVYLSHDRDAATLRGDRDAARDLGLRWRAAGELADELRALSPDRVDTDTWTLHELRALVAQLGYRLDQLVPLRRAIASLPPRRATLTVVNDRVVAYLRVSTDRQAEGFGLDVQEAAIRLWARQHRARIIAVARDEGRSGTPTSSTDPASPKPSDTSNPVAPARSLSPASTASPATWCCRNGSAPSCCDSAGSCVPRTPSRTYI